MTPMRYRLKARFRGPARLPKPSFPAVPPPPRSAELDNPYGRCYTRPRSFQELLERKPEPK